MNSIDKKKQKNLERIIALSGLDGIGTRTLIELLRRFGDAEAVFKADRAELEEIPRIRKATVEAILGFSEKNERREAVGRIAKLGWNCLIAGDSDYPKPLETIDDRPAFLFYQGNYIETDQNAVAIVGSRKASEGGLIFARQLGTSLAERGITVISGMARGIDTAAHRGALEAGGRTIAVLGSSLDKIYPPENRELARQISESGAVVSEFLPETIPEGHNFPRRNRIISGLSYGVVVIEAAERSGALSTANHALSQNREVFAVPGSPRSETSRGTNRLIKEGARMVTSVDDIFEELPMLDNRVRRERAKRDIELLPVEKKLIDLFDDKPVHIDMLCRAQNVSVTELMPILLALELKGVIKELSGKRYILN